ncbi:hypothetical protein QQP08_016569 [Theobroma cacao]|nr:hypothetical protein QQP08_016569 [Theobroma cacao]
MAVAAGGTTCRAFRLIACGPPPFTLSLRFATVLQPHVSRCLNLIFPTCTLGFSHFDDPSLPHSPAPSCAVSSVANANIIACSTSCFLPTFQPERTILGRTVQSIKINITKDSTSAFCSSCLDAEKLNLEP